jgi:hypothetical protein
VFFLNNISFHIKAIYDSLDEIFNNFALLKCGVSERSHYSFSRFKSELAKELPCSRSSLERYLEKNRWDFSFEATRKAFENVIRMILSDYGCSAMRKETQTNAEEHLQQAFCLHQKQEKAAKLARVNKLFRQLSPDAAYRISKYAKVFSNLSSEDFMLLASLMSRDDTVNQNALSRLKSQGYTPISCLTNLVSVQLFILTDYDPTEAIRKRTARNAWVKFYKDAERTFKSCFSDSGCKGKAPNEPNYEEEIHRLELFSDFLALLVDKNGKEMPSKSSLQLLIILKFQPSIEKRDELYSMISASCVSEAQQQNT